MKNWMRIIVGAALLAATAWVRPAVAAMPALRGSVCFAEVTGDDTTDYSSGDAQAVRDAVAAANTGGVVKLAGVCVGVSGEALVVVDKALTLQGGYANEAWMIAASTISATVLDAQNMARVISATAPLTIENLIVQNGIVTSTYGGGAFFAADAVISATSFVSNSSVLLDMFDPSGGAGLYAAAALVVNNSRFEANSTPGSGAALYSTGDATLMHVDFFSNTAENGGGAIYHTGNAITVVGGAYERNTILYGSGAAVYVDNSTTHATMDAVTMRYNDSGSRSGGAIYVRSQLFTVTNSTFESNRGGDGGALYLDNTAWIFDSVFFANTGDNGGAVYFNDDAAVISGSQFISNTSSSDGGGLQIDDASDSTAQITNTVFMSNAGNYGGGAYISYYRNPDLYGVKFIGNVALQGGGGMWYESPNDFARFTDVLFERNSAASDAGGLAADADFLELVRTQFLTNTTSGVGGALWANGASAFITDSVFQANSAVMAGGGLHLEGSGNAVMRGVTLTHNSSGAAGGALYSTRSILLTDGFFYYNQADTAGHARMSGSNRIERSRFLEGYGNNASTGVGGILLDSGDLTLVNDVFDGNQSNWNVTAVQVGDTGDAHLIGLQNTFVDCFYRCILAGLGGNDTIALTNTAFLVPGAAGGVLVEAQGAAVATLNGVLSDTASVAPMLATSGVVTVSNVVDGSYTLCCRVTAPGNYLTLGAVVDSGVDSGVSEDIRGLPRPVGIHDIGAYELAIGDSDASLIDLAIAPGTLTPSFVSSTLEYAVSVPSGTTQAAVTATTSADSAAVSYASSAGGCALPGTRPGVVARNAATFPTTCDVAAPKTWITATVSLGSTAARYVKFVSLSEAADRGLWASASELGVLGADGSELSKSGWTVSECSSAHFEAPCSNAIDGDTTTIWHTDYPIMPGFPYTMAVDLGEERQVSGLTYLPRQIGSNGHVGEYQVYISVDGATWMKVSGGVFADNSAQKTVRWGSEMKEYSIEITMVTALTTIDRVWPGTGLPEGGMPVQIFGSGFAAALTVTVGPYEGQMVAVPFVIASDGQIDFVMPAGVAGQSVSVTVQTADDAQTAADAFTYVQPDVISFDGETGGVFTTTDGVVVEIPPQGVSGMFVITMTPLPPAAGVPGNILMYSFRLDAMLNWVPLASLTNPVTIKLPIDEGIFAIADGERPWLYSWTADGGRRSADGGRWVLVRGQEYDPGTKVMTVALRPMGVYALSTAYLRAYWFPQVPVLK